MSKRVPGFRQLPLRRRARVLGLAALQHLLDERPGAAARLFDRAPAPVRETLRTLAAPLRIARASPAASLDVSRAIEELESVARAPVREGTPSVSIVIPTQGSGRWLALCLAAITAHTRARSYEIVVVDDGAAEPTVIADTVRRHPRTSLLRLDPARGFAAAVNAGVERTATDRLVLLNDDAVVTPGWIEALDAALDDDESAGLVGPTSNDTGDVATAVSRYTSLAGLIDRARDAHGQPVAVDKLSLFCALLRRSTFEAVGGLDDGYGSGMFEDDDLCMTLRARGLSVLLAPSAFVHHGAGATLRRQSPLEYLARFEVNRRRFEQRWNVRWRAPRVGP